MRWFVVKVSATVNINLSISILLNYSNEKVFICNLSDNNFVSLTMTIATVNFPQSIDVITKLSMVMKFPTVTDL